MLFRVCGRAKGSAEPQENGICNSEQVKSIKSHTHHFASTMQTHFRAVGFKTELRTVAGACNLSTGRPRQEDHKSKATLGCIASGRLAWAILDIV